MSCKRVGVQDTLNVCQAVRRGPATSITPAPMLPLLMFAAAVAGTTAAPRATAPATTPALATALVLVPSLPPPPWSQRLLVLLPNVRRATACLPCCCNNKSNFNVALGFGMGSFVSGSKPRFSRHHSSKRKAESTTHTKQTRSFKVYLGSFNRDRKESRD